MDNASAQVSTLRSGTHAATNPPIVKQRNVEIQSEIQSESRASKKKKKKQHPSKNNSTHIQGLPTNTGRRYNTRHHTSALETKGRADNNENDENERNQAKSAFDGSTRNELLTSIDRLISRSLLELNNNSNLGVNKYKNNHKNKHNKNYNQYKSAPNLGNIDQDSEFGSRDSIYHMQEKTIRLANGMEANVVIRAVKKPETSRPSLIQSLQPSTSLLSMTGVYPKPPFSDFGLESTHLGLTRKTSISDTSSSKGNNSHSSSSSSIASDASSYERRMKEKYLGYTNKKVFKKFNKTSNQHKRNICDIYMDQRRRTEELLLNLEMDLNTRGYGRLRVPASSDDN